MTNVSTFFTGEEGGTTSSSFVLTVPFVIAVVFSTVVVVADAVDVVDVVIVDDVLLVSVLEGTEEERVVYCLRLLR